MIVHQILPNFSYGDAIGDDTLALQRIFRDLGHESEIYAGVIHPYLVGKASHWKWHRRVSNARNLLVYHFSVGSEIAEYLLDAPDRLALIFHNITPPHWFFGVSPHMTELASEGVEQLAMLKDKTEAAWADSEFNASILREIGYRNVSVLPIIFDFRRLMVRPDPIFVRQHASKQTTWLFTGRVTPNKCHQDIIRAFSVYKKCINPHSRLFLVGDVRNCWRYSDAMIDLVKTLGVPDVLFTGMIDDDQLAAAFRMSDLFICMSEHEGYCVPLLEAMHFDLPVIAFDAGAVSGTMRNAGILLRQKDPVVIAELAHTVLTDTALRAAVIERQRERLKQLEKMDFKALVGERMMELGI
jgi:L-malate glycosyltransferase